MDRALHLRDDGFDGRWMIELGEVEARSLRMASETLWARGPGSSNDAFLIGAQVMARELPERVLAALFEFRKRSNPWGALLLRNLPQESDLPATPAEGSAPSWTGLPQGAGSLLFLMSVLGDAIAYSEEKGGALIQDICPVAGKESHQENCGSVLLEFHTEDGFHPHRPDFVGLRCLRSDHDGQARTAIASVRQALPLVSSAAIAVLRRCEYRIRMASSFGSLPPATRLSDPLAVLSGDLLQPDLCVDFHAMVPLTDAGAWALSQLQQALRDVAVDLTLAPGDVVLIDNRVAAHGRTSFRPRYDGFDRWLLRMFAVTDLRRSQSSRAGSSHVCAPLTVEHRTASSPHSGRPACAPGLISAINGHGAHGNAPNGNAPNGNAPNGNAPNGNAPNGNAPHHNGTGQGWEQASPGGSISPEGQYCTVAGEGDGGGPCAS